MNNKQPLFQAGRYRINTDYQVRQCFDMEIVDVDWHCHEFYECIFFYSGDILYNIGSSRYYPTQGDVLLLDTAQFHRPVMRSAIVPYERTVLSIDKAVVERLSTEGIDFVSLFKSNEGRLLHLKTDEQWATKALLTKLATAMNDKEEYGHDLLVRCYLTEMLICLSKVNASYSSGPIIHSGNPRIIRIKNYIEKNLSSDLSLEHIAQEMNLSKYYLSHEFKKFTGMSLYAYIIKLRLAKTCEMMRGGYSIADSYSACGFNELSVFSRSFKKEYGITPKEYLASLKYET